MRLATYDRGYEWARNKLIPKAERIADDMVRLQKKYEQNMGREYSNEQLNADWDRTFFDAMDMQAKMAGLI